MKLADLLVLLLTPKPGPFARSPEPKGMVKLRESLGLSRDEAAKLTGTMAELSRVPGHARDTLDARSIAAASTSDVAREGVRRFCESLAVNREARYADVVSSIQSVKIDVTVVY